MKAAALLAASLIASCSQPVAMDSVAPPPAHPRVQFGVPRCSTYEAMAARLVQEYGERPASIAAITMDASRVGTVVFFVSPSMTWTMVILQSADYACIMATGEAWRSLPQRKA